MKEEKKELIDECFRELANAIVLQAVKDYREAILSNDTRLIRSCERFFKSKWCYFLSGIDCSSIAGKLRDRTLEFKDQAEKTFKEKADQNDTDPAEQAFKCPICGEWVSIRYDNISFRYRTKGYVAECKSCDLTYKRRYEVQNEQITR